MVHFNGHCGIVFFMTEKIFTEPPVDLAPLPHMILFSAQFEELPHDLAKRTLHQIRASAIHCMLPIILPKDPIFENEKWIWRIDPSRALRDTHKKARALQSHAISPLSEPESFSPQIISGTQEMFERKIVLNYQYYPYFARINNDNTVEKIKL